MSCRKAMTRVQYKIGYQIVDGKRIPLTKEQEEWAHKVLDKALAERSKKEG